MNNPERHSKGTQDARLQQRYKMKNPFQGGKHPWSQAFSSKEKLSLPYLQRAQVFLQDLPLSRVLGGNGTQFDW